MKFKLLGLNPILLNNLKKQYITETTDIQEKVIPPALSGRNIIARAQTGTGKTLSYLLPIFQKQIKDAGQALILAPTRELCEQVYDVAKSVAPDNIRIVGIYGGHNVKSQADKLQAQADVVIATPGRLMDHIRRGNLNLKNLEFFVVDEVDQMFLFGFAEDILFILKKLPAPKQTFMLSATVPSEVVSLGKKIMSNILMIESDDHEVVSLNIKQFAIITKQELKLKALIHYIKTINPFMAIIYCNSKARAEELYNRLITEKFKSIDLIQGDMSQNKRERILKNFKDLKTQFLISTDLTARGLDIAGITHIINYDIPKDKEYYVHRIGRTGRMGEEGSAVSIVSEKDINKLEQIEKKLNLKIKRVYNRSDIEEKKISYPF